MPHIHSTVDINGQDTPIVTHYTVVDGVPGVTEIDMVNLEDTQIMVPWDDFTERQQEWLGLCCHEHSLHGE